jgi:hypothetical protein
MKECSESHDPAVTDCQKHRRLFLHKNINMGVDVTCPGQSPWFRAELPSGCRCGFMEVQGMSDVDVAAATAGGASDVQAP